MRRDKWFYEFMGDQTLLDIAADLHMSITGASDCTDHATQEMQAKAIRHALDTWSKPLPRSEKWDNAVKWLLEAVVAEWEASHA
jgi:hypothetical protein